MRALERSDKDAHGAQLPDTLSYEPLNLPRPYNDIPTFLIQSSNDDNDDPCYAPFLFVALA